MIPERWIGSLRGKSGNLDTPAPRASFAREEVLAEHESNEVVSPVTAPFLDRPVVDLHGGNEPVTWAGGSLELVEVAEHRPTSALDRDPTSRKWMVWAVGGSIGLALILTFAFTRGDDTEAGDGDEDPQAAVEIPSAPPEPELAPEPVPEPEPEKKTKTNKRAPRTAAATSSTLAAATEKAVESKPAAGASKPAASKPAASKPAASKPAPAPTPTPTPTPSKPAGPNLAPPEDEGSGSKAELPDVSGWDDADAAVGDRSAEEL
jgi:hypothetical protein